MHDPASVRTARDGGELARSGGARREVDADDDATADECESADACRVACCSVPIVSMQVLQRMCDVMDDGVMVMVMVCSSAMVRQSKNSNQPLNAAAHDADDDVAAVWCS